MLRLNRNLSSAQGAFGVKVGMARKSVIKPGDVDEDPFLHPCSCLSASAEGREVWGVSLMDGSYPRTSDPGPQRIRQPSLEAWTWRSKDAQPMPEDAAQVPDQEGWWPRPVAGINPGHVVEHMFSSSLLFLRNQYIVCERLGGMPIGWWEASSQTSERGATGNATASYITHGPTSSARVEVVAEKEGRLWPIRLITIAFGDGALKLRFESEAVRGCGHAR